MSREIKEFVSAKGNAIVSVERIDDKVGFYFSLRSGDALYVNKYGTGVSKFGVKIEHELMPGIVHAMLEGIANTRTSSSAVSRAILALEEHAQTVAIEAEQNNLRKRRDALANEFSPLGPGLGANWYRNVGDSMRRAIDRIIELESKVQS